MRFDNGGLRFAPVISTEGTRQSVKPRRDVPAHSVIQLDSVHLRTATELLGRIMAGETSRNPPRPCIGCSTMRPLGISRS